MEADTMPLTPESRQSRKLPMLLMLVMWSLGIIEWHPPSDQGGRFHQPFIGYSKCRRRLVFTCSMFAFFLRGLVTVAGAASYVVCYIGKTNQVLGFVSTLFCYWPPLMYWPILCITGVFRNMLRTHDDVKNITCMKVLRESTFIRQVLSLKLSRMTPLPKVGVFILFHGLGFIVSFLILLHLAKKPCWTWLTLIWVAAEIISIFFYATFSYFIYLQRIILEEEGRRLTSFISENKGDLDDCITKIQRFFCNYMNLRRLLLPWLCMILFSVTFGLTLFLTWIYNSVSSNQSTSTYEPTLTPLTTNPTSGEEFVILEKLCPYTCDGSDYLGKGAIVCGKVVMSVVLTFVVIQGLDLKYVWDNFSLNLHLMFSANEYQFWERLTTYVDTLHPTVTFNTLFGFVIPVLAIAIGVFGEGHRVL